MGIREGSWIFSLNSRARSKYHLSDDALPRLRDLLHEVLEGIVDLLLVLHPVEEVLDEDREDLVLPRLGHLAHEVHEGHHVLELLSEGGGPDPLEDMGDAGDPPLLLLDDDGDLHGLPDDPDVPLEDADHPDGLCDLRVEDGALRDVPDDIDELEGGVEVPVVLGGNAPDDDHGDDVHHDARPVLPEADHVDGGHPPLHELPVLLGDPRLDELL
ncbi:MAG: hypothetical protein LUQ60_02295 [Methanomicrobiales archaeon]|nr:hypothetical protein [Methanomicrobiales archaeon]